MNVKSSMFNMFLRIFLCFLMFLLVISSFTILMKNYINILKCSFSYNKNKLRQIGKALPVQKRKLNATLSKKIVIDMINMDIIVLTSAMYMICIFFKTMHVIFIRQYLPLSQAGF